MPGVNVIVQGTQRGIQTDFYGKFSIKAQEEETIVFSYLGMEDVKIKVIKTLSYYNIKMKDDNFVMGEVVFEKKTFVGRTFNKIKNWFR